MDRNPRAIFVNSDNHTLNLFGVPYFSQELEVTMIFRAVERLYNFFAKSAQPWKKIKDFNQSCIIGRAFRVGQGSGISLSECFWPISGLHIKFFKAVE